VQYPGTAHPPGRFRACRKVECDIWMICIYQYPWWILSWSPLAAHSTQLITTVDNHGSPRVTPSSKPRVKVVPVVPARGTRGTAQEVPGAVLGTWFCPKFGGVPGYRLVPGSRMTISNVVELQDSSIWLTFGWKVLQVGDPRLCNSFLSVFCFQL
jgi:hypothetical protein